MASGKASKRRRAAQQAAVQISARRNTQARADRRVWIAAAAAAAIALAVAIGIISTSDGETDAATGSTLPDAAEATALFRGVPQQGVALGSATAPVTLVEFVDMQCPFCRDFEVQLLPSLVEKQVRTGELRVEIRGLTFVGPDSERGMRAVLAAGLQNHLYELLELLYFNQGPENSGWLSQDVVEAAARSIPGLDPSRLVADTNSAEVSELIAAHKEDARQRGVNSTPTVLVGKTGGELAAVDMASPTDAAAVREAIATASKS